VYHPTYVSRFLAIAVITCVAAVAEAKPKVAFAPIVGDDSGEVAEAVTGTLDEYKLVPAKELKKKIKSLGLGDDWSDKDFVKLEKELEADAIVQGTLEPAGKKKSLTFKIYVHGKKAKGFSVQFSNPASDKFQKAVHDKLVEKIAADEGEDVATDDDKPKKKKKKKDADEETAASDDDDKPKKHKKKKDADDETAAASDDDDKPKKHKKKKVADDDEATGVEADAEDAPKPSFHAANRAAIRVDAGISVATRSLTFTSRAFTEGKGPPKPYSNSAVPGARIEGELYPLAFSDPKSPASGLGLGFDFDQTISLTLRTTAQPDAQLKATQRHWTVGLRYRYVFGPGAQSPSLTFGLNYGGRQFKVDRTALTGGNELDLPDVQYKMYQPSAAVRVPVAPAIALVAMGRAMIVTSAGDIVSGMQYGQGKVFGFEAQAGLDIVLGDRFAIRLVGEFSQVGYTFNGVGELAKDRDNDPTTPDVGGATDRSIGGSATLAVLY